MVVIRAKHNTSQPVLLFADKVYNAITFSIFIDKKKSGDLAWRRIGGALAICMLMAQRGGSASCAREGQAQGGAHSPVCTRVLARKYCK